MDENKIEKADALVMNQQYDQAEKLLLEIQTDKLKIVAKVKLLDIYFTKGNKPKIQSVLQELESVAEKLQEWGFFEEYLKAKNYAGINLLNNNNEREASKLFKKIIE